MREGGEKEERRGREGGEKGEIEERSGKGGFEGRLEGRETREVK